MNDVLYKTKSLIRSIKRSNEYNQYQRLQKKLANDKELFEKVNEFRRKNFQIQNGHDSKGMFQEIELLRKEYDDILSLPVVEDFFASEQRICTLMRNVYESLADTLEFDIDFLEK